jgi:plasmid stabilization system protein ParE
MYRVVYHKAVAIDIAEALTYYNDISPRLSNRFEEELFNKIQDIQQHPLHYGFLNTKRKKYYRRAMLKTFPYKIVYSVIDYDIIIFSVMHGRKSPGHLNQRFHA